jgi:tripartite ATP-independent transporter DctM subunit
MARRRGYPAHPRATLVECWTAFRRAFLALVTPAIIMAGIFGGIFTPTEAAAVAAIYALAIGVIAYRSLGWGDVLRAFRETVETTAVVGLIVAAANLFGWILARERVPQMVAELFLGISSDPSVVLLVINLLLLALGCVMEGTALLILLVPMLAPLTAQLGIDPVHFGVVVIMNLMIGILTPPFGVGLFVVSRAANIPFVVLARGIVPLLIPLLIVQATITFVPATVLFLPRFFGF